MRYFLLSFLLFFSLYSGAAEPIKIGVITDTHYLSEQLMDNGIAVNNYVTSTGKNVKDVPAVLDKVLNEYLNSDIDVLLITGDITKDGEKQSHLDFVKKLKSLQDKGIRVFVIPGNHDINMPNTIGFKGDKTYKVDNIIPDQFASIYSECGYKDAIERDPSSLSYVARLDDNNWLMAIDAARYKEYTTQSLSSGKISADTEKWIIQVLNEAKEKNIQVIGMMHWGLTEHIAYQSEFFGNYLVDDWQRLATVFADNGLKAIFTGHFHTNDITLYQSPKGNKVYDIETGTLSSYPYSYRFTELEKGEMKIETRNIISIPNNPNLAQDSKQTLLKIAERQAIPRLGRLGIDMPKETSEAIANLLGQIFIMHAFGDEKMNDDVKSAIDQLTKAIDVPMDLDDFELDFYPADNNVKVVF